MGIGAPPEDWDWADYVLGKPSSEDRTAIDDAMSRNHSNLREVLFELYDRYERERRGS